MNAARRKRQEPAGSLKIEEARLHPRSSGIPAIIADTPSEEFVASTVQRDRTPGVTPHQVAVLAGVGLSLPLRAAYAVVVSPAIVAVQIGKSISRAVRPGNSAKAIKWDTEGPLETYATYDQRMILQGREFRRSQIRAGVEVVSAAHHIPVENIVRTDDDCTFKDNSSQNRLDIVSHGGVDNVDLRSAKELAEMLWKKGVRRVGVINVDSCRAGSKTFLEDLGNELDALDIKFGWIAGARGATGDLRRRERLGRWSYNWSAIVLPWKRGSDMFTPRSLNRKILKGNIAVDFKGTVFNARKSPLRIAASVSPLR